MWAIGGVDDNKKSTSTVERSIDDVNFIELLIVIYDIFYLLRIDSIWLDMVLGVFGLVLFFFYLTVLVD